MSDAADAWRRAVLELRAWRVLTGRALADERDRLYADLRLIHPDQRGSITELVEVGLELGVPDAPSTLEAAAGMAPPRRPPDWRQRLASEACPSSLDQEARARAWHAIATLHLVEPSLAATATDALLLRCAAPPVPQPLPCEAELLVARVHHEPALASARDLLDAAAAHRHVHDWQLARAVRETRATVGEPWASWLAWTVSALLGTLTPPG